MSFFETGSSLTRFALCFLVTCIAGIAPPSVAQESRQLTPEAIKLRVLQSVLQRNPSWVSTLDFPYCTEFMRDLRAGRQIVAVEPDVRAASEDDPALAKLHHCKDATLDQMQTTDPNAGFTHIGLLGGPPFRYYRIDIDGNPNNGKEDLLYHELTRDDLRTGHTGYSWIDIKGCFVKGGAPVTRSERTPKNFMQVDLVAKYRSEYIVLDMYTNSTDPNESRYRLRMYRLNRQKPVLCAWNEPGYK